MNWVQFRRRIVAAQLNPESHGQVPAMVSPVGYLHTPKATGPSSRGFAKGMKGLRWQSPVSIKANPVASFQKLTVVGQVKRALEATLHYRNASNQELVGKVRVATIRREEVKNPAAQRIS